MKTIPPPVGIKLGEYTVVGVLYITPEALMRRTEALRDDLTSLIKADPYERQGLTKHMAYYQSKLAPRERYIHKASLRRVGDYLKFGNIWIKEAGKALVEHVRQRELKRWPLDAKGNPLNYAQFILEGMSALNRLKYPNMEMDLLPEPPLLLTE